MKKKAHPSEFFVSLCFLAFLFTAMVVTLLEEKEMYSFFENRNLASWPVYKAGEDYIQQLERWAADHAAFREGLLREKTRLDLALRRPVVNDIVMSQGHFLPYLGYQKADWEEVSRQAEAAADKLAEIRDAVEDYGGRFCYAAVPNQYVYSAQAYPEYMDREFQTCRWNVELLSAALADRGVAFLDVGAEVEALGRPVEYMSRVDHHYTMEGAFLTYQILMDRLKDLTREELPVLGEEDVTFETLPNPYLGSRTRKLMGVVDGAEHLQLLWPREPVPFTRTDGGAERSSAVYNLPEEEEEYVTYEVYMGGDMPQTTIDTSRKELPTILIYGESYTNALECILYLSFDRMDSLDLRHYRQMSLIDYIRVNKPDIVVGLRDYSVLLQVEDNG